MTKATGRHKRKSTSKGIKVICALLACLLLAGCGSSAEESHSSSASPTDTAEETFNKDCIYSKELIQLVPPMEKISEVFSCDGKLYLLGSDSGDDAAAAGYDVIAVCVLDGSGMTEIARIPREWDAESQSGIRIRDLWADTEGNIYLLEDHYTNISVVDSVSVYQIIKLDSAGNQLWKTEETGEERPADVVFSDGYTLVSVGLEVKLFDGDGKETGSLSVDGMRWIGQLFTSADDRVFVKGTMVTGSTAILEIDAKKGRIGEKLEIPEIDGAWIMTGYGYDLFLQNTNMIVGYNIGDSGYTEILDFVDSDIALSSVTLISPADGEHFLMWERYQEEWYLLSKVPPEEVKEKQIVTVGYLSGMWITQDIIQFNQSSDSYKAVLRDYSAYVTSDNPNGGLTQLNNDIGLGNAPDVLVVNNMEMPIASYVEKGVFEDLYTWLDSDPELSREDFWGNVLEAYSTDGKLYQFPVKFSIFTAVGKTSVFGERTSLTFDDLEELMGRYPDSVVSGMSREGVFSEYIKYFGGDYVDADSGTCRFDAQEFIDLLEWMAQFPEEIDWNEYYQNSEVYFRENKELLYFENFNQLNNIIYVRDSYFQEEITPIGFPVSEGSGSVLSDYRNLAIFSGSSCKEGAWEFIRYFLTEEYQSEGGSGFPIREDVLEKQIKDYAAPEKNIYTQYPLSEKEVTQYIEFMGSISRTQFYDQELLSIITEESQAFFAGQKTAEKTAEIIQRRASLYMAENQ